VKHFVGSYSIAGMLVMLLGAIAEKEIYVPSSAVIAESGPEAHTHFLVHTFSPGMNLLWKLGIRPRATCRTFVKLTPRNVGRNCLSKFDRPWHTLALSSMV